MVTSRMAEPTGGAERPGSVVISVDAMGGDRGPATVIAGIAASADQAAQLGLGAVDDEPDLGVLVGARGDAGDDGRRAAIAPHRIDGYDHAARAFAPVGRFRHARSGHLNPLPS